jgi:hypothetical protein
MRLILENGIELKVFEDGKVKVAVPSSSVDFLDVLIYDDSEECCCCECCPCSEEDDMDEEKTPVEDEMEIELLKTLINLDEEKEIKKEEECKEDKTKEMEEISSDELVKLLEEIISDLL